MPDVPDNRASQLEGNLAQVDAAIANLDAKSAELEANDPAPADPA